MQIFGYLPVDIENRRGRIVDQCLHIIVDTAHLLDQFTHVLGAGARGGLVSHRRDPLDQPLSEQAADGHQHQRNSAVAAHIGLDAVGKPVLNDILVNRIEHDDRLFNHPQCRSGIDPIAVPARLAQFGVDLLGVVAALAGDDHIHHLELIDAFGIPQRRHILAHIRTRLTGLGGGEKDRFDIGKIVLFTHALHQHRADHTAPTYQTYFFHCKNLL